VKIFDNHSLVTNFSTYNIILCSNNNKHSWYSVPACRQTRWWRCQRQKIRQFDRQAATQAS